MRPASKADGEGRQPTDALAEALLCVPGAFIAGFLAWSGDMREPSALEGLYLARLAVCVGGGMAGLWWLMVLAERRYGSRGPWLTTAAWFLIAAPKAVSFGRHLSRSDGLRWGALARDALAVGVTLGLLALVAVVWMSRRAKRRAPFVGAAVLLAMLVVDRLLAQRQSALAPFVYALGTGAAVLLLRRLPRRARSWLTVAPIAATMAGLLAPRAAAEARRRVLVRETSLALVAMQGADVGFEVRPAGLEPRLSAQACAVETSASGERAAGHRNAVIITIDTVRNDDARATIDGRPVMPNLQRFMARAWTPPYAVTGYPATMMALSSAFAGVPSSGVVLAEGTVPSIFRTLAPAVDEVVVALPSSSYFARPSVETLIVQGARRLPGRDGAARTKSAIAELRRLRKAGKSHLVWIHYFEPHAPYRAHRGFDWGNDDRGRYRSELAATDHELGRLLKALGEGGWYDDSLIMVFSDHGESFGEHDHAYHHFHLYPWLVRVPFAMHVPGGGARQLPPLHLMDVAPTLHDYFGVPAAYPVWGRSQLADAQAVPRGRISEEFPVQVAVLEQWSRSSLSEPTTLRDRIDAIERGLGYASKLALTSVDQQLVVHRGTGALQLFDLRADPRVEHDLGAAAARNSPLFAEYEQFLRASSRHMGCAATP